MKRGVLVALLLSTQAACAAMTERTPCGPLARFEPFDEPSPRPAGRQALAPDGPAEALVRLYQAELRNPSLPGEGCQFAPSCSEFARLAVAAHGPLGLILAFDRLFVRDNLAAPRSYPTICTPTGPRLDDRVP